MSVQAPRKCAIRVPHHDRICFGVMLTNSITLFKATLFFCSWYYNKNDIQLEINFYTTRELQQYTVFDWANHSITAISCTLIRWSWYTIQVTHYSSRFCIHNHRLCIHSLQLPTGIFSQASIIMVFSSLSTLFNFSSKK